ncbi:MAG TPA: integrating conjugative element protein [Crenotrichaceae bacterium]|nr:integrating conjugative element protein [Crenotrichaceae bacterium]
MRWIILFVMLFSTQWAVAETELFPTNLFPTKGELYYEIGGATSIPFPANYRATASTFQASVEVGLGYSCGNFDPTLGVANILNSVSNIGNDLVNGVIGAVTAAIGSLPALILQRINPGLYDLFQNGKIRAEAIISLANASCEEMERQIANGENPYKDWIQLSKSYDWKVEMGTGGWQSSTSDVSQAKEKVETDNGKNGVPWIGGRKAGGENQPAIHVPRDVVKAGYNMELNRWTDRTDRALSNPSFISRQAEIWPTPRDAEQWAVEVLGDLYIYTYSGHPTHAEPGHGLLLKIDKQRRVIRDKLTNLVYQGVAMTEKRLEAVSAPGVMLNTEVLHALKRTPTPERDALINKLASEAAMAQVLEKAMLLRRFLLSGMREPNVVNSPAPKYITETLAILDQDIKNVLFEKRIRTELVSNTAHALLKLQAKKANRARQAQLPDGVDKQPVSEGATTP